MASPFKSGADVSERSAAQDVDDERIRLAPVLPGFGWGRRDRCADRLQLIELKRIGGLVALGDPNLDPLQVVDHVGQIGRFGERRGGRRKSERGPNPARRSDAHGSASRRRISIRRFSAASGCAGSLRRWSAIALDPFEPLFGQPAAA